MNGSARRNRAASNVSLANVAKNGKFSQVTDKLRLTPQQSAPAPDEPEARGSADGSKTRKLNALPEPPTSVLAQAQPLERKRGWPEGMNLWHLDVLDGYRDGHYAFDYSGRNVHVYLLTSDAELNAADFSTPVDKLWIARDLERNRDSGGRCTAPGNFAAGLTASNVAGVAKDSKLHIMAVAACRGAMASESAVAKNLREAVAFLEANIRVPAVIALALPAFERKSTSTSSPMAQALRDLQALSAATNAMVVAPSPDGDDQTSCTNLKQLSGAAIVRGVSKNLENDVKAAESSQGGCANYLAPGNQVWSIAEDSSTFEVRSGSVPATAIAAGIAALILEARPASTPKSVLSTMSKISALKVTSSSSIGTTVPFSMAPLSSSSKDVLAKVSAGLEIWKSGASGGAGGSGTDTVNASGAGSGGMSTFGLIALIFAGVLALVLVVVMCVCLMRSSLIDGVKERWARQRESAAAKRPKQRLQDSQFLEAAPSQAPPRPPAPSTLGKGATWFSHSEDDYLRANAEPYSARERSYYSQRDSRRYSESMYSSRRYTRDSYRSYRDYDDDGDGDEVGNAAPVVRERLDNVEPLRAETVFFADEGIAEAAQRSNDTIGGARNGAALFNDSTLRRPTAAQANDRTLLDGEKYRSAAMPEQDTIPTLAAAAAPYLVWADREKGKKKGKRKNKL